MNSSRPKGARSKPLPAKPRRLRRTFLLAVGVLVGSVLAAFYAPALWKKKDAEKPAEPLKNEQREETAAKEKLTVKPAASPYKNTQPGVQYVGSAACIKCHEEEHKSY